MPERSSSGRAARGLTLAVDVVLFTPLGTDLAVLLAPAGTARTHGGHGRERSGLPTDTLRVDESLDDAAIRIARDALGGDAMPSLLEQAATLGGSRRTADGPNVSVTYFGLVPEPRGPKRAGWVPLSALPPMPARQRHMIDAALAAMRSRVDQQPIAFRLLRPVFTLSELQTVYELLLGRGLHKASFRRALRSSSLVEATDEWRSEGRGRPAQLFRYAPPRRRRQRRGIRFDVLG